jgi:hypothetical protein
VIDFYYSLMTRIEAAGNISKIFAGKFVAPKPSRARGGFRPGGFEFRKILSSNGCYQMSGAENVDMK